MEEDYGVILELICLVLIAKWRFLVFKLFFPLLKKYKVKKKTIICCFLCLTLGLKVFTYCHYLLAITLLENMVLFYWKI
jgi:hypothetical protein